MKLSRDRIGLKTKFSVAYADTSLLTACVESKDYSVFLNGILLSEIRIVIVSIGFRRRFRTLVTNNTILLRYVQFFGPVFTPYPNHGRTVERFFFLRPFDSSRENSAADAVVYSRLVAVYAKTEKKKKMYDTNFIIRLNTVRGDPLLCAKLAGCEPPRRGVRVHSTKRIIIIRTLLCRAYTLYVTQLRVCLLLVGYTVCVQ